MFAIANTPLHFLFMGTEAVIVFFVLSGFVLSLPILQGRPLNLWSYFPRRVLRIWLPAAASIVLAVLIILITGQDPNDAVSTWGRRFSFSSVTAQDVVSSLMLITGSPNLNNPMWSLKWEMLFSLFLPIALLLTMRARRHLWVLVTICAVATGVGTAVGVLALKFGPMFLAGCFAARIVADRASRPRVWEPATMILVGITLIWLPHQLRTLPGALPSPLDSMLTSLLTIGAALIVVGLTAPSGATTLLSTRPFRFLGRISFGLYLVHVPILLAGLHVAPDFPNRGLLVTIPIAFVAAWLFTRHVEEPSARLARNAGTWLSRPRSTTPSSVLSE